MQNVLNVAIGDSIATSKRVAIVPGWEYRFVFYDSNESKKIDTIAMVKCIYTDSVCIVAKNDPSNKKDCSMCSNTECIKRNSAFSNTNNTVVCNCFTSNKPDMNNYSTPKMYYVPIGNIMDVEYIKKDKPKDKERGTKVVLLGISATMLRALILHLEFFDDKVENAVKYVDIEVGGTYNFVYQCGGRRPTIYEVEGKVVSIEEVREQPCKTDKQFVREVGKNDFIYECCNSSTSKEEFIKGVPVKAIKIVVDTSTVFESKVETIMLDSIRDCIKISSANDNAGIEIDPCEGCVNETCDCDPATCPYCNGTSSDKNNPCVIKPKTYTYNITDDIKVEVCEDKAKIFIRKEEPKYIPIEEILKFYIGDETGEETHFGCECNK